MTLLLAWSFSIIPLPHWATWYRPEWLALLIIYWTMAWPERIGVGFAWCTGLILDGLSATIVGQYALAMSLVAYLTLKLHQRLRLYPLWQQTIVVFLIIGLSQLLVLWIHAITGQSLSHWHFWLPTITSMLIWPWLSLSLNNLRGYHRKN